MEAPVQVRRAVMLLWFMLSIVVIAVLLAFDSFVAQMAATVSMPGLASIFLSAFIAFFIINAFLIVCVSRRHNWARFAILILTMAGLATWFWPDIYSNPLPWDWWVSNVAFDALSLLALYWLFTGPGAQWFSKAK